MSKLGVKSDRVKATGAGFVSIPVGSSNGITDYLTGYWDGQMKLNTPEVDFVHGKCGVNRYAVVEATEEEIDAIIKESEFVNPVRAEFYKTKRNG